MKTKILMPNLDSISVNGIDFSALSVEHMQAIIRDGLVPNYAQLKGWVIAGPGSDACTLTALRVRGGKVSKVELLDFQSVYDSANCGLGNDEISRYVGELLLRGFPLVSRAQDHIFLPPVIEALRSFTGLERFYLCSSGTRAVEVAIDLAFRHWCNARGKKLGSADPSWKHARIVSATASLHGRSRTARSLASETATHTNFGPLLDIVEHVPFGDSAAIEKVFSDFGSDVVAVVLEPVQGMPGWVVPPEGYLQRVSELCTKHGSTFVLDEIRTGFGRTGTDWAFERFGVKPDLLCFGKSAGGGIEPLSGVGGRDDIMSSVEPGGMLFDTFSATPQQCVALLATIKLLCDHDLARESDRKATKFFAELQTRFREDIVEIRGLGFARAMQTRFPADELRYELLEQGMWTMDLKATPNTIFLDPPLVITEAHLAKALDMFDRAFTRLRRRPKR